jgi:hypothetical protein
MIISGSRSWARVEGDFVVLVIYTVERRMFVILCRDRPRTYFLSGGPTARVSAPLLEAAGYGPRSEAEMVELWTIADAQRVAPGGTCPTTCRPMSLRLLNGCAPPGERHQRRHSWDVRARRRHPVAHICKSRAQRAVMARTAQGRIDGDSASGDVGSQVVTTSR